MSPLVWFKNFFQLPRFSMEGMPMFHFHSVVTITRASIILFGVLISMALQAGTFTNASTALTAPAVSTGDHTVSFKTSAWGTHHLQEKKDSGSWTNVASYTTAQNGSNTTYPTVTRNVSLSGRTTGTYSYRVYFVTGNTITNSTPSGYSNTKVTVVSSVPNTPPSLTASPDGDDTSAYSISWGSVTGVVDYYILEQQVDNGPWSDAYSGTDTSVTLTGFSDGTQNFRVRACNSEGCSDYQASSAASFVVSTPTSDTVSSIETTTNSFTASWLASSGNVDKYQLYRKFNDSYWTLAYEGLDFSATFNNLADGHYQFWVRACNTESTYTTCSDYQPTERATIGDGGSGSGGGGGTGGGTGTGDPLIDENIDFGDQKYDVYIGDVNNDGIEDIYLDAVDSFILIQSDASVPLLLPKVAVDILLTGYFDENGKNYNAAVVGELTDAELLSLNQDTTSSSEYKDTNNDGILDLIIKSNDAVSTEVHLSGGTANSLPASLVFNNNSGTPASVTYSGPGDFVATVAGSGGVTPSGAGSYQIPVVLPKGVQGINPSLSINYNSQGVNGLMGHGWSMSGLSLIHRCRPSIAQDGNPNAEPNTAEDRFCLDGKKLKAINGQYGADGTEYRTELDQFSKIISYGTVTNGSGPTHFKVWNKSGAILEFGVTQDARVEVSDTDDTVSVWALNKVEDRFNNYYTVSYFEDSSEGEFYPTSIDYTANDAASLSASYSVDFTYVDRANGAGALRSDLLWGYRAGSKFTTSKLLSEIKVTHQTVDVSSYAFAYNSSPVTGHSRLETVTRCGYESGTPFCAQPTNVAWQDGADSFGAETNLGISTTNGKGKPHVIDVNGNGIKDLMFAKNGYWYIAYGQSAGGFSAAVRLDTQISQYGALDAYWGHAMPLRLKNDNSYGLLVSHYFPAYNLLDWYAMDFSGSIPGIVFFQSGLGHKPMVADINGDGRDDIMQMVSGYTSAQVLFRNTKPLSEPVANPDDWYWDPIDMSHLYSAGQGPAFKDNHEIDYYGAQRFDFDGDGYDDVLAKKYNSGPSTSNGWWILESSGNWITRTDSGLPFGDGALGNGLIMDVNNDGLGDFVSRVGGTWQIRLNLGGSFSSAYDTGVTSGGAANQAVPLDYDGDGIQDLLVEHPTDGNWRVLISSNIEDVNGDIAPTFLIRDTNYVSKGYLAGVTYSDGLTHRRPEDVTPIVSDPNGDGLGDLIYYHASAWKTLPHSTEKPDLVSSVTDGFGVAHSFTYTPLTDNSTYTTAGNSVFPIIDTRASIFVVKDHSKSDAIGGTVDTGYTYKDAKIHLQGYGFLGFAEQTATNNQTGIKVTTKYNQNFPYIGLPSESKVIHPSGHNLEHQINTWQSLSLHGGAVSFPYLQTATTQRFDLTSGTEIFTSKITSTYDNYGNQTNVETWTGKGLSSGNVQNLERHVTSTLTYSNDETNWLLGFLNTTTTDTEVPGETTYTQTNNYTQLTGTLVPEEMTELVATDRWRTTTYTRNGLGVITSQAVSAANAATRTTQTLTNFIEGQYPQTVTNALGHSQNLTYDLRFGQIKNQTDVNGLVTKNTYDAFGRNIKTEYPDSSIRDTWFEYCTPSKCTDEGAFMSVSETTHSSLPNKLQSPRVVTYHDILGRTIRVAEQRLDGDYNLTDTLYDTLGRVESVSQPYLVSPSGWNTREYDIQNRVVRQDSANGALQQVVYGVGVNYATSVTVTDTVLSPDGVTSTTQTNSRELNTLGQLMKAIDNLGTPIDYLYNAQGLLRSTIVNNDAATEITINYDVAGNKLNMTDPSAGLISYVHDGLGLLREQTNARSQMTTYSYDLLNRLTTQVEPEGTITNVYDTATNGIGKLAQTSNTDFSESYLYDSLGRATTITDTITGRTPLVSSRTFDAFSRVSTATYPQGFAIQRHYNDYGYQYKVTNSQTGDMLQEYRQQDVFGNVNIEDLGNGISTYRVFNQNSGQVQDIVSGSRNNAGNLVDLSVQNLMYQFDTLGNLFSRRSGRSNTEDLTETFDYDGLNRLISAETTGLNSGTRTQSYQYDVLGNITYKSDVGSYTYGATCASGGFGPHAVCETSGTVNATYGYDTSGNMTTNKNRTLTYSSYNKPLSITEGSTVTNFSYNANHKRYKQVKSTSAGTVTTYYMMGGQYEEITDLGKGETKYKSYLDSFGAHIVTEVIATAQTTEELQYYHRDHLGSTEAITDEQGVMVERFLFDPSGNRRDSDWEELPPAVQQTMSDIAYETTSQGFTGHEQLDSHNLTHMGGRIYDPVLGRFMSVDPFIQAPANTQSFNRYSYVFNNPLSYTDPTGYITTVRLRDLDDSPKAPVRPAPDEVCFIFCNPSIQQLQMRQMQVIAARAAAHANQFNARGEAQNIPKLESYSVGNSTDLSTIGPQSAVSEKGLGEEFSRGVSSFFRGLYRYVRHERRILGREGVGHSVQANTVENMLLGEALGIALHANQTAIKAGGNKLLANGETIAGRQLTSILSGVALGGGGMGPSLGVVAGMGDVYFSIESLALELNLDISTVDHTKPILPQISDDALRSYAEQRLGNIANTFLSGQN